MYGKILIKLNQIKYTSFIIKNKLVRSFELRARLTNATTD